VTLERGREEFRSIAARMAEQNPVRYGKNMGFSLDLDPLAERPAGDLKTALLVLMAAAGVVLLIACANVSNLLLARATARRREAGIRAALGAARSRVVRQLLTESLVLSAMAGTAGVLLAIYGLHLYGQFGPRDLIRGAQPAINSWVMAFSILLSIVASIVFGLGPALETSAMNLAGTLKEGSHGSSKGGRLLRESMIAAEVAASLILVIGAGLLVRSFIRLEHADPGFRPEHLLTAQIALPVTLYTQPAQRVAFQGSLLERVAALPGVKSVAATEYIPFVSGPARGPFEIIGHPRDRSAPSPVVVQSRTSAGYFETMGIPFLRGRGITPADDRGTLPVAVVDETLVKKYFADLDPIGMEIQVPIPNVTCKIIGIVGGAKYGDIAGPPLPAIYYSAPQLPSARVGLAIKTANDPLLLVNPLRHEVTALDSNLPITIQTMQQALADSLARQRLSIQLMTVFAAVAALLTAIGIYGVLAYLVDRRRREIGIRMALGACPIDVLTLVLRQGSLSLVLGLALGVSGALGLTRILSSLLYEVSATDPLTFTLVSLGLIAIGLLAMIIPARRATQVDPMEALRRE
jgi:putative ABC transport system permease protein